MGSKILEIVKMKLEISDNSLFEFASFTNDSEFLAVQNKEIFKSSALIKKYEDLWFELESLNACALSEWEEDGRPKDYSEKWNAKYKKDAYRMLKNLNQFLESL